MPLVHPRASVPPVPIPPVPSSSPLPPTILPPPHTPFCRLRRRRRGKSGAGAFSPAERAWKRAATTFQATHVPTTFQPLCMSMQQGLSRDSPLTQTVPTLPSPALPSSMPPYLLSPLVSCTPPSCGASPLMVYQCHTGPQGPGPRPQGSCHHQLRRLPSRFGMPSPCWGTSTRRSRLIGPGQGQPQHQGQGSVLQAVYPPARGWQSPSPSHHRPPLIPSQPLTEGPLQDYNENLEIFNEQSPFSKVP